MPYRRPAIRVDLANGFWADVEPAMSMAGIREIARLNKEGREDEVVSAMLLRAIKAWNICEDDGRVLPVTAETVDLLYQDDMSAILDAVNTTMPRKPDEQADFLPPATPGREDAATLPQA